MWCLHNPMAQNISFFWRHAAYTNYKLHAYMMYRRYTYNCCATTALHPNMSLGIDSKPNMQRSIKCRCTVNTVMISVVAQRPQSLHHWLRYRHRVPGWRSAWCGATTSRSVHHTLGRRTRSIIAWLMVLTAVSKSKQQEARYKKRVQIKVETS